MTEARKKADSPAPFFETDLYLPVRKFLVSLGFTVRSEVKDCDVCAEKDGKLIIVELKKHLSVELLVQAVKRQKIADLVYMAVPKPKRLVKNSKWKDLVHLIRRLELGLLFVTYLGEKSLVEVAIEPLPFDRVKSIQKHQKKRIQLLKEMDGRCRDANVGGSKGRKLMTAYRENALFIAVCLEVYGQLSPKQLRHLGTDPRKTASILQNNFYHWFTRVENGIYALSDLGREGLKEYAELAEYYRQRVIAFEDKEK